jgi:hypothetical protein
MLVFIASSKRTWHFGQMSAAVVVEDDSPSEPHADGSVTSSKIARNWNFFPVESGIDTSRYGVAAKVPHLSQKVLVMA